MTELTEDDLRVRWWSNDEPYAQIQMIVKNTEVGIRIRDEILTNQKLRELIEKWRKEVYLQLNEIANSKRTGNDYHLQLLNLHTKIVELLMESKK